jgi:hypothetical protein
MMEEAFDSYPQNPAKKRQPTPSPEHNEIRHIAITP